MALKVTYSHPKYTHLQEVEDWETVRRALLEKGGWVLVKPPVTPPVMQPTALPVQKINAAATEPTKVEAEQKSKRSHA